MQQEFAGRVELIGIAGASDSIEAMEEFVADTGVGGFAHAADLDNKIWQRYGVRTQPTFVFIDDDGSTETVRGLSESDLAERMQALFET